MRNDVFEGRRHDTVGHGGRSGGRVELRRLHKPPVVDGVDDVVVDQDGGRHDLARPRVDPRRPHGILHGHGQIADTGVLEVVGVEGRVVGREVLHLYDVLESDALERLVPSQNARLDGFLPQLWKRIFYIIDDRFDWLRELSGKVSGRIPWLYAPAIDEAHTLQKAVVDNRFGREEHADAGVAESGSHRLLRQERQCEVHADGDRVVGDGHLAAVAAHVGDVVALHLHAGVRRKRLQRRDARPLLLQFGVDPIRSGHLRDDGEITTFLQKERGGVEENAARSLVSRLDGEREEVEVAVVRRFRPAWVTPGKGVHHLAVDGLHHDGTVFLDEADVHQRAAPQAQFRKLRARHGRDGGPDQHVAAQRRRRKFDKQFAAGLVQ